MADQMNSSVRQLSVGSVVESKARMIALSKGLVSNFRALQELRAAEEDEIGDQDEWRRVTCTVLRFQ